jgi:hypothetical protein
LHCRHQELYRQIESQEVGVKGYWFIKANLIRDLAALNKIELLPFW